MNFVSFKREANRFHFVKPLRLGGEHGVLARHIVNLQGDTSRIRWILNATELLDCDDSHEADSILFLNTGDSRTFYYLESIVGISSELETELVLRMRVVEGGREEDGSVIATHEVESQRSLCESLLLSGGYRGGTWKWYEPPMGIGAAIV